MRRAWAAGLAVVAAAAGVAAGSLAGPAAQDGDDGGARIDFDRDRLVDLSHAFDRRTIYWPTARRFRLTKVAEGETEGGWFYAANNFAAAEHGGTHLDAPIHFARGGDKADEVPLRRLAGAAVTVDVRARARADRDLLVGVADLEAHERREGAIPRGAIVLLRTGWGSRWPDARRYLGTAQRGDAGGGRAALPRPGRRGRALAGGASARSRRSGSTRRASTAASRRRSRPTASSAPPTCRSSRTWRSSTSCPPTASWWSRCR